LFRQLSAQSLAIISGEQLVRVIGLGQGFRIGGQAIQVARSQRPEASDQQPEARNGFGKATSNENRCDE
jgi:hypothetical protein